MALPENILTPIPGDNPGGVNLRYDPISEKIKEARREDDELPTGEWQTERKVADHKTVVKLATEAIATKSKDLQIAAWLTESLLKTQGFAGFNEGLALLSGILMTFWEHCYPVVPPDELPPPDGEEDENERAIREDEYREEREGALELRAAPLSWITATLDIPLRQAPITKSGYGFLKYKESRAVGYEADASGNEEKTERRNALIAEGKIAAEEWDSAEKATGNEVLRDERASLRSSLETLKAVNEFCQEKFGELAPHLSPLRQTLEELAHFVNGLLKQRGDVEGAPAEGDAEGAVGVEGAVSEASLNITGATPASPSEVGPRLDAIARFLRGHDPQNPAPYTMLRGYRWGELRAAGGRPDPRKLEAPSGDVRQRIKKFALEGNWQGVIETGEKLMSEAGGRAWLDLQRYVVQACGKLGYRMPAAAIRSELRALLLEMPGIPDWTLMDDSPTASAETRLWLKQVVAGTAPVEEGDPIDAPIEQEGTPLDEAPISTLSLVPDAYQMALEAGNAQEAVRILNRDLARQPSGRARFQRRLQMARICFDHGQSNLAHLFLEQLQAVTDEHKLDGWETGEMVASALALLYKCKIQRGEDPSVLEPLYNRIATLDPVQALNCSASS